MSEGKRTDSTEVDAIRRHICQILGFDYGFIDAVRGHEIKTVTAFSADEDQAQAESFVRTLVDEHKQAVTAANTLVAQKVKQTQHPLISKVFSGASDAAAGGEEAFPYAIIPVMDTGTVAQVRGLIRVISFDASKEISNQDLATLKLMGEHLFNQLSQLLEPVPQESDEPKDPSDNDVTLVVHSKRPIRRRYTRILGGSYPVLEADTSDRALEILRQSRVDLIVLDSEVVGTSGYAFCKILKDSTEWKDIPVIIVTADTNPAARVEGLNVGADDCLSESCFDSELLARVKSSLRHRQAERELAIQLQLLEDYALRLEQAHENLSKDKVEQIEKNRQLEYARRQSDILQTQQTLLHRISNTIRRSFNITENLHEMLEELSGWFNLDCCFIVLPSDSEPEDYVRTEYARNPAYSLARTDKDLSVLGVYQTVCQHEQVILANDFQNNRRLEPFLNEMGDLHAQSFFCLPITYERKLLGIICGIKLESKAQWNEHNEAFLKSVADQIANGVTNARLYSKVQRQATTDGLTGLFNHRTGQEKLTEQMRLAERYQRNLSVVMLDVDHFKSINDNYGHPAGDSVLKSVAKLVRSEIRDVDFPVRYGGEEFLLVLPEVNQEGAVVVAERIRKNLAQEHIQHEGITINVTASFGIASFPDDAKGQQALLDLADKSLYLSKRLGRNQVHTASDLLFEEVAAEPEEAKPMTIPPPKLSEFVPASISEAAEQKEELVPEVIEMVKALATALYSKSEYNKAHHLETARLSELLGKVMGLNQQQIEQIRVAGLLHDVGTLSIPSDLLNKPGILTEEERKTVNQHPVLGAQLLRPIRALRDICEILENHHERWDGTGFPHGLKGEEIPLPARIVSIVDSYHAMISERPYRKALSQEEALRALKEGAGRQWDPFLVDIFVAVILSLSGPGPGQGPSQPGSNPGPGPGPGQPGSNQPQQGQPSVQPAG